MPNPEFSKAPNSTTSDAERKYKPLLSFIRQKNSIQACELS